MYIMNRRPKPKRRLQMAAISLLSIGLLVGSGVAALQYLDAETKLSPTPAPVVTKVLGSKSKVKNFTAGPVTLDLPQDWEPFTSPDVLPGSYSWRNTIRNKGAQVITAYIDNVPSQYAVNRVLVVAGGEDRLQLQGSVSENCVDFVEDGRSADRGTGKTPARWGGVQFICDTANYVRNVVGISSAGDANGVKLVGESGPHRVYLTYTDSNADPNNSVFTSALESLRVH